MKKTSALIRYFYRHPFVRYVFVGGTTFAIDIGLLLALHGTLKVPLAVATTLSYWTSIIYNFALNRYWTFSRREKEDLHKHATAYLTLLAINYLFTVVFVSFVSHFMYFALAKALAVIIQTSWTYMIYKKYIFTARSEHESTIANTKGAISKA